MSDTVPPVQTPAPATGLFGDDLAPPDSKAKKGRAKKPATTNGFATVVDPSLPPNLGKALSVEVPDFNDPNRPKTCLEVDFPLVPINALSALEGNAGKPIYQMSKWWARRRSCVFRALLLAAAMKAPTKQHPDGQPMLGPDGKPLVDDDAVSQAVWDAYYANHQLASHANGQTGNFKHLKVLDPFMGGGTTLVEGSRLGFQVAGVDLNPVAWFIVKNELACTDPAEVKAFFDHIEAEVKPQVQPFYVTDGVGGKKGRWFEGDKAMPEDFDPLSLPPAERKPYRYEGSEVIYTFWAKHGTCSKLTCRHRTPIFRSPIVATKRLGVKFIPCTCKNKQCGVRFDAELGDARIAPDAEHVVLETEAPYTVVSAWFTKRLLEYSEGNRGDKSYRIAELSDKVEQEKGFCCPRCGTWSGQSVRDVLAMHRQATRVKDIDKKHLGILPPRNGKKHVYCSLLIDPDWLKGAPGVESEMELGGFADAPISATASWYHRRQQSLRLIEVRGNVNLVDDSESADTASDESEAEPKAEEDSWIPETITLSSGRIINTKVETIARKSNGSENEGHFLCAACGDQPHFAESVQQTRRTAPVAPYAIQAYDPARDVAGSPYGGRYFKIPDAADVNRLIAAEREWTSRRDADLNGYWPREEMPFTYMTHQANFALPEQGYTHWYKMFNPRQLVVHAALLKAVVTGDASEAVKQQALGAVQQYLRMQNMFVFWHITYDKIAPALSNPNFHPKNNIVENNVFGAMGYGTWLSCAATVLEALEWCGTPKELAIAPSGASAKTIKVEVGDPVLPGANVQCGSSSEPRFTEPFDLVITDPPFGDNIFYSDLSNFFYVWLRLPLMNTFSDQFGPTKTPNAQEALKPRVLSDADGDQHYYDRLTPCWVEACRVMKDGGLLAFTFHHSEDAQWEIVLRSLFDAGLYLEATYPIASDEMKGKGGQFGAKGTEYDIIHVCRKRLEDPKSVSWPKMRQWVKSELARLRPLLESFKNRGLSDADIRVILRGKALEFYSRHYGKVLVSAPGGEDVVLSIRDALLGINQLLDETGSQAGERPPSIVQPVVYQYLRLFGSKASYSRDEVSKLLRGTAIQQKDFEKTNSSGGSWIDETDKVVRRVPIGERFKKMKARPRREMKTELDQAHFLIGAAFDGSGVNIDEEFEKSSFLIRPGVEALLAWYIKTPGTSIGEQGDVAIAADRALTLMRRALEAKRARMRLEDPKLWDEWEAASLESVA